MSSSVYQAYVRFADTARATDAPLSAHAGRTLVNNHNHFADSAGQVRVAWQSETSLGHKAPAAGTASDWHHVWTSGAWPATIREDGTPYPLRVMLRGASSSATTNVFLRLAYGPVSTDHLRSQIYGSDAAVDDYVTVTCGAGESHKWLTPNPTFISIDSSRVSGRSAPINTLDSIGGPSRSVSVLLMHVSVWALTQSATAAAQLSGVYAAEYVGK